MVDNKLLTYIHGRLRQIKQTGDFSPFGKVSVIAVGDFFQLPPVKGKSLCIDIAADHLWANLFHIVELKTIVRQKEQTFAELLNRLRVRSKDSPMLPNDIQILKRCETGEDSPYLHIYPTNAQVNEHNVKRLFQFCPEYIVINAQDYANNPKTGKRELKRNHHAKVFQTCLTEKLLLGNNARVMLTKNVDVMDGLVNGVCGTVTDIITSSNNIFPQMIYVEFDDKLVGTLRRKQSAPLSPQSIASTGIKPEEDHVTSNGGLRRQFPLKLAWACTVHKVQGTTVDNAVVSLKKIFAPGQAYVALSRVRNLSGLVIQDFEDKAIYCKENIQQAIQRMEPYLSGNMTQHTFPSHAFNVFLMNVQSLPRHVADLTVFTQRLPVHCIAVTETWLPASSSPQTINIDGFSFHSCPRSTSYTSDDPSLIALQNQHHGGVGMYNANNLRYNNITLPNVNLECLVYNCVTYNILIAVIYRPPSYPMALFKTHLSKLLDFLDPLSDTIAVMISMTTF